MTAKTPFPQVVGKHTPGPWAVTSSTGDIHSQARNGENWVCQGPNPHAPSSPSYDEIVANARLIAAAPCLLEALISLAEIVDDQLGGDFPEPLQAARAAIKKATQP